LFVPATAKSQLSLGITIGGIAFHQGSLENSNLYSIKIDKKGRAVVFGGVTVSVAYRINDYFGVKAMQSLIFHDSAGQFAGISHFGVVLHDDLVGMKSEKHQFSTSIGPFWYYRKGWSRLPGYNSAPEFMTLSNNSLWERKFVWLGGFFNYNYSLDGDNSILIDFLPAYPHLYAVSGGVRLMN